MVGTAEEVVELLVPQYADFASVDLLDWVLGADRPPMIPEGGWNCAASPSSTRPGNPRRGPAHRRDRRPPAGLPARPAPCAESHAVLSQAGEPEFVQ
ncbi:hypothetical protein LT493_42050 [Streptomyces tricolor]|nr:hypothetical protein [Streptomyces tricolor]